MVRLFCAFRKNLRVLFEKVAFQGDLGERVEVWGSSEHQREQSGGKRGNAQAYIKAHDRVPQTITTKPAKKETRPGRAGWHDRATMHGLAVLPGTAVPRWSAARLKSFSRFFLSGIFCSFFSSSVLFGF